MQQTSALILQLWQQPILLPSDLPGSAFRQNVLKLILESTPVKAESVEYPVEYSPSPKAP